MENFKDNKTLAKQFFKSYFAFPLSYLFDFSARVWNWNLPKPTLCAKCSFNYSPLPSPPTSSRLYSLVSAPLWSAVANSFSRRARTNYRRRPTRLQSMVWCTRAHSLARSHAKTKWQSGRKVWPDYIIRPGVAFAHT